MTLPPDTSAKLLRILEQAAKDQFDLSDYRRELGKSGVDQVKVRMAETELMIKVIGAMGAEQRKEM